MSEQYEVDVLVADTIIVEADSANEAAAVAKERGYPRVTAVRFIEDDQ